MQQARDRKSFGKYRLIASLGAGGMAKVYLALMAGPAGFNKLLVIKILREDLDHIFEASTESLRMFWKEARLAARLNHPNIVQTHEVGEIEGRYFIAMEYLDGQPYTAILSTARKLSLPVAEHLRIVSEVARALHYSHTLKSYEGGSIGIVHRDVSPHNIVVTYDGQVKLLDFGVATSEEPENVTRVGVIKGKLDYIAPEQLRGDAMDGRADIFALGAVLWEALSGQRFGGGRRVPDAIKIQTRLVRGEGELRELRPDLPEELLSIVERATALHPGERFADAAAFANALDAHIASRGERPTSQSLSALLAPHFEGERARLCEIINAQLQAQKSAAAVDDGEAQIPRIERESHEGLSSYVPEQPDEPSARIGFERAAASGPSAVDVSTSGPAAQPPRPSTPALPRPRLRDAALLIAGSVALGAVLALLWPGGTQPASDPAAALAQRATQRRTKPATAQEPLDLVRTPESQAPRREPVQEVVLLQVNIDPADARLTVDDVTVEAPFSGQFRKDGALHVVEASAPGFRPLKQLVRFERDQTLALALSRSSGLSRRGGAAPLPTSSASQTPIVPRVDVPRAPAQRGQTPPASQAGPLAHTNRSGQVRSSMPGANIAFDSPSADADDIYLTNPYRRQQ